MISILKSLIPYKSLPRPLRKIIARIAHTSKAKYVSAFPNMNHVLNGLIAYNKYGGYCIPLSSHQRPVVQQILKGRVHEDVTIEYIRKNCGKGDVIHAGTYFGDFLPGISAGLSSNAKVWAFEPNVENFKYAQVTIILNGLENVILRNAGLGESESVQKMLVQTQDGINLGGASMITSQSGNGKTIEIDILSVDNSIPKDREVSIIQLDVEGYEIEVLRGALETIRRCKPVLILEDNADDIIKSDWVIKNIASLGYEVAGKVHLNTILKSKTESNHASSQ